MWVFLSMYFLITLVTFWKILAGSSEKYSAEAPVENSVVFHVIAVCGLNFLCLWQKDKKGKRSRLVAWRGQPARSIVRGDETGLCPMRNSRLSVHTALNCFIFRSSYGLDLKNKDFKNEKHTTLITKASNRLKGGNSTWLQLDQQKHDRGHKQPWELCWEVGPDEPNGFPRGGTAAWEEAHGDLHGFFLSMAGRQQSSQEAAWKTSCQIPLTLAVVCKSFHNVFVLFSLDSGRKLLLEIWNLVPHIVLVLEPMAGQGRDDPACPEMSQPYPKVNSAFYCEAVRVGSAWQVNADCVKLSVCPTQWVRRGRDELW